MTRNDYIRNPELAEAQEKRMRAYAKACQVAGIRWDCFFCEDSFESDDDEYPKCPKCGESLTAIPINAKGERIS